MTDVTVAGGVQICRDPTRDRCGRHTDIRGGGRGQWHRPGHVQARTTAASTDHGIDALPQPPGRHERSGHLPDHRVHMNNTPRSRTTTCAGRSPKTRPLRRDRSWQRQRPRRRSVDDHRGDQPAQGHRHSMVGNDARYAPDANANGADTFTYTLADGQGGTDTATGDRWLSRPSTTLPTLPTTRGRSSRTSP